MDKDQAQRIIKETFENKFYKARFTRFIIELLNLKSLAVSDPGVAFNTNQVPNAYQPFINSFEKIADYRSGEHKLDVLVIRLKRETSIERARTMQRNFIAWYLRGDYDGEMKDASLAAFVSPDEEDWRFSLIKMDYSLGEDKKGRVKISEEFTPAKRWSFLVGSNEKSHTAQSQLIDILAKDEINPTLTQLEESFNIETVTKEFFKKYKELFFWTKETLDELISKNSKIRSDFKTKNINTVDFSKKLLGQIVFLYFLQKKGWFGVARDTDWGTGPKNFLRELFDGKHGKYKNFYNDILEPLFYEALRNDRSYDDDYYRLFNCKIPFLNGGLFDPINNYDWVHTDINLPDDLFSNEIITKERDKGTGILDIFDRYNFTVKEDEPLEKEVAVDPEMLGKVFENLLEVKDRKSKGTYYTPREIVHYMCQQSLINYLDTEMEEKVSRDDIEKLIKYGEQFGENNTDLIGSLKDIPESIIQNAKLIDEKLADIKVCEPAVGSGAFLVEMMGEIVRSRNALSNYLKDSNRTIYNFKRDCIENSLYGVDIDPGAVEIAKLRLWLSLVVDEEDIKQIKPLPNLDYKIVCGNSLMSIEKNLFNQELFSELESLKKIFFDEINPNKKQEYKNQINNLISQITDGNKEFDFEIYFSEVFHEKSGFDIIIANPPYLGEKGNKEIFREIKKMPLGKFYLRKMDIFYFFFNLAINISKKSGQIAFITTNYYITADGAKKLRQDFKNRVIIKNLINFNELKIFESATGQHNMITILCKISNSLSLAQTCITKRTGVATAEILQMILNQRDSNTNYFTVSQKDLYDSDEFYIRLYGAKYKNSIHNVQEVLNKIKSQGQQLVTLCKVNQGLLTGVDKITMKHVKNNLIDDKCKNHGVYVLSEKELFKMNLTKKERKIIYPFYKNSDIDKYYCNRIPQNYLIYATRYLNIEEYPNIYKHFKKFEKPIKARSQERGEMQAALKLGKWWVIFATRNKDIFLGEKIISPQRSYKNKFAYNQTEWFASADVYFITQKNKDINLKYILALLNSKLYFLWLYHRGKRKGEMLEMLFTPLSEIQIKKISEEDQSPFIDLVDKILTFTQYDDYQGNEAKQSKVSKYEKQIDQLVYKLYSLTEEEVKIIEEEK